MIELILECLQIMMKDELFLPKKSKNRSGRNEFHLCLGYHTSQKKRELNLDIF